MPTRLSVALSNAKADQLAALLDAGSGAGYFEIRNGTQPADVETAPADGGVLATVTLQDPSFGAASGRAATINDPASVNGTADGTATWCRWYDSDDNAVLDGEVSATGGTGLVRLSNTAITTGNPVDITGVGTWTVPME